MDAYYFGYDFWTQRIDGGFTFVVRLVEVMVGRKRMYSLYMARLCIKPREKLSGVKAG